jgi:phosphomannomutase
MSGIFKTYDIRGIYPDQLNNNLAFKIGHAISNIFKTKKVLVCYDIRTGSKTVRNNLIAGLLDHNSNNLIVDAGLTTTPMFYYVFSQNTDFDFGVMITASHNPKQYTGMKLLMRQDNELKTINYSAGIKDIEKFIKSTNIKINTSLINNLSEQKNISFIDYKSDYFAYIKKLSKLEEFSFNKIPEIVVDYSSGTAPIYSELIKKTANVIELNNVPDGDFPNHPPNPLLGESQKRISDKIRETNADFGLIFDGDADRIVFLDEHGEPVSVEAIIFLMVEQMKHENKLADSVAYTINLSKDLEKSLNKINVSAHKSRIGYSFVRQVAINNNSAFGAERSAHYSFRENAYLDSAILCYLYVLKSFCRHELDFSQLIKLANINSVMIEHAIHLDSDDEKLVILRKCLDLFKDEANNYDDIDGYSFFFDNYWFNIRQSNTEPIIRVTIETENKKKNYELFENIKEKLRN